LRITTPIIAPRLRQELQPGIFERIAMRSDFRDAGSRAHQRGDDLRHLGSRLDQERAPGESQGMTEARTPSGANGAASSMRSRLPRRISWIATSRPAMNAARGTQALDFSR